MKKLLAILLALCVVGVAFAEDAAPTVTTAVSVWGEAGVYNNATDTFLGGNNGIDLDFDVSSAKFGFSTEFEFIQDGTAAPADQYFNYAYGWYQPIEMVKINFGYLWNSSYRLRNSMLQTMMGGLMNETAVAVEFFPVEGLSLAVSVPFAADKSFTTGTPGYSVLMSDALKEIDLFAKYVVADVGTFYASYQMSDANSTLNGGADLKLVPNAKIQLGVNYAGLGAADIVGQDLTVYTVLGYTMDALTLTQETNIYSNNATPELKAFGWLSNTIAAYRVGDVRLQGTVNLKNKRLLASDYILYTAEAAARFYEGSNYLNVAFKYYGATDSADALDGTWKIPVAWSIAF